MSNGTHDAFTGKPLLIGYWPAGYPTVAESKEVVAAMVAGGVDMLEIGLPYSDPVMDGPRIAAAAAEALAAGMQTSDVFAVVGEVSQQVPTLVMTYWNPIEQYGLANFCADLAAAGGVGVITPDLPIDEAAEWCEATDAQDLGRVFVVAPSSEDSRLTSTTEACSGFVYAASFMGVTGAREPAENEAKVLVERVRQVHDGPVAVGLGVSTAEQARAVATYADGAIVGTAFVAAYDSAAVGEGVAAVRQLAQGLAAGVATSASE